MVASLDATEYMEVKDYEKYKHKPIDNGQAH